MVLFIFVFIYFLLNKIKGNGCVYILGYYKSFIVCNCYEFLKEVLNYCI